MCYSPEKKNNLHNNKKKDASFHWLDKKISGNSTCSSCSEKASQSFICIKLTHVRPTCIKCSYQTWGSNKVAQSGETGRVQKHILSNSVLKYPMMVSTACKHHMYLIQWFYAAVWDKFFSFKDTGTQKSEQRRTLQENTSLTRLHLKIA